MNTSKTVYTTFDTEFNTWNAMNVETGNCEFYGSIEQLEEWLEESEFSEE